MDQHLSAIGEENMEIKYFDRDSGEEQVEKVYGDWAIQGVYGTRPGQALADLLLSKNIISQLYGVFQNSRLSVQKIQPFVEKYNIRMDEFEEGPFSSFNRFFIRKFKPGKRPFVADPNQMGAFAEGRYYAYESVTSDRGLPVKGKVLSINGLLGANEKLATTFEGGPVLLARLCPTDYHRFHFPDEGHVTATYSMSGPLHSVNPVALDYHGDILATNERSVSILESKYFGTLAYVEVGALCVGKIVQTYEGTNFSKGLEKGYFLFGGSTVLLLGQKGKWVPDADLLAQTQAGRETLVRLGTSVATATPKSS